MSSDPIHPVSAGTAERRPAVWPWLLLPLVALTLFFALSSMKKHKHPAAHPDITTETASGEAAESR